MSEQIPLYGDDEVRAARVVVVPELTQGARCSGCGELVTLRRLNVVSWRSGVVWKLCQLCSAAIEVALMRADGEAL